MTKAARIVPIIVVVAFCCRLFRQRRPAHRRPRRPRSGSTPATTASPPPWRSSPSPHLRGQRLRRRQASTRSASSSPQKPGGAFRAQKSAIVRVLAPLFRGVVQRDQLAIILSRTFLSKKAQPMTARGLFLGVRAPQTPASDRWSSDNESGYRRPAAAATPVCSIALYLTRAHERPATQSIFRATAQMA